MSNNRKQTAHTVSHTEELNKKFQY